jgi:hypothetical protein
MTQYQDIQKISGYAEDKTPITKTVRAGFAGGTLTIYEITTADEKEVLVPTVVQPWKCNSDGTREDFVNAEDAFAWAASVIDTHL